MSDLITRTLNRIDDHQNLELPLDGDLTLPYYDGLSLANLAGTVTQLLGAPAFGRPPLDASLLESLGGPYKKVVFLLVDALGYNLLTDLMEKVPGLVWNELKEKGVFSPITSVCPSTTASALTTLWTGMAPACSWHHRL